MSFEIIAQNKWLFIILISTKFCNEKKKKKKKEIDKIIKKKFEKIKFKLFFKI